MPNQSHGQPLGFIPSPSVSGFHLGPLFIHVYGLMYVVAIALAIYITRRRWAAQGGNPDLVWDVALWAVPAGIIGARIYFDITTPADIPHHWYGIFEVWSGGLGIWGGIAAGAAAGIWRLKRAGVNAGLFANAIAPALLVAQAVGRIGNYFNQELFGKPSTLPWALQISPAHRPAGYLQYATFQPSFLYELIFDLAWAAWLVWLGNHRKIRPWGLFALYVAGYSAYRIFEETIRIDSSEHLLGLRLNFYVATILALAGIAWFLRAQRGPEVPAVVEGSAHDASGPAGGGAVAAAESARQHNPGDDGPGDDSADDDGAGADGADENRAASTTRAAASSKPERG